MYPNPRTQEQKVQEAKEEIEKAMKAKEDTPVATSTSGRTEAENNIIGRILQVEVPIEVQDLHTLP